MLIIYQALDMALTGVIEKLFRSSDGAPTWVWGLAVLSVILNMVAPMFISFWLLTGLQKNLKWKNLELMIIESLRAWGSTFLWSLLLILPGLMKWFSYSLVSFVVLFSKKYDSGSVDALQYSQKLFARAWGRLILTVLFFYLLLPLVMAASLDSYRKIWITPLFSLGASLLDYAVLLLGLFVFLRIFKRTLVEVQDEFIL